MLLHLHRVLVIAKTLCNFRYILPARSGISAFWKLSIRTPHLSCHKPFTSSYQAVKSSPVQFGVSSRSSPLTRLWSTTELRRKIYEAWSLCLLANTLKHSPHSLSGPIRKEGFLSFFLPRSGKKSLAIYAWGSGFHNTNNSLTPDKSSEKNAESLSAPSRLPTRSSESTTEAFLSWIRFIFNTHCLQERDHSDQCF